MSLDLVADILRSIATTLDDHAAIADDAPAAAEVTPGGEIERTLDVQQVALIVAQAAAVFASVGDLLERRREPEAAEACRDQHAICDATAVELRRLIQ